MRRQPRVKVSSAANVIDISKLTRVEREAAKALYAEAHPLIQLVLCAVFSVLAEFQGKHGRAPEDLALEGIAQAEDLALEGIAKAVRVCRWEDRT